MRRGRVLVTSLATALLLGMAAPVRAEDAQAQALVKRVLDAIPKGPLVAKLKLTVEDGPSRQVQLSHKFVSGARASYLEVTAPPELQGIRFLFLQPPDGQNEQYIKVAASRTAVRVSEEIRKQPFLGSTFYVSDLVEPPIDNYTFAFAGEEELLGRPCKLVRAEPKNPSAEIYSKTVLALDPKDLLILRRQFFDAAGKLIKVWTIHKVEQIDGNWTLVQQEMANVQEGKRSKLDVVDVQYNAELKDVMFTPKYLLR